MIIQVNILIQKKASYPLLFSSYIMLVILRMKILVHIRGAQACSGDALLVSVHVAPELLSCLVHLVTHLALHTPRVQVMLLDVVSSDIPPLVCELTLLAPVDNCHGLTCV